MKNFLLTFVSPIGHAVLTVCMVVVWFIGASMDVSSSQGVVRFLPQILTSLAISVFMYLLVEGAMKLENTRKLLEHAVKSSIADANAAVIDSTKTMLTELCREKIAHIALILKEEHLHEIMLAVAVPAQTREQVLEQQDLKNFTAYSLQRYLDSLSKCQFYEKLDMKCHVFFNDVPCPDGEKGGTKKFVKTELDVEIDIRRFGTQPFLVKVDSDNETKATFKRIVMEEQEFVEGVDYEIADLRPEDGVKHSGWEIRFLNDRWAGHELATVSYSLEYFEFDHWTDFTWVAGYPTRSMTADFRCQHGLSKKEFVDICEINGKIRCRDLSATHCEVYSVGWIMPGNGFSAIFSDTQRIDASDFVVHCENDAKEVVDGI